MMWFEPLIIAAWKQHLSAAACDELLQSGLVQAVHTGEFILGDEMACSACNAPGCDRAVMKISTATPVCSIDIERLWKLLPQSARIGRKNCDFLLCDYEDCYASRKLAFCDLTCSEARYVAAGASSKYPEGKRQYVVEQMLSTMNLLTSYQPMYHFVATSTSRRFIFGWREKQSVANDTAAASMRGFFTTPSATAPSLSTTQTLDNLKVEFVEIKYPQALVW